MRQALLAPALVIALALAVAVPTSADANTSRQHAKLSFTKRKPGKPTGLVFRVDYVNPDDSAAKPPAVRRVVLILASGARFDTSVPAACTASDPELMLQGPLACPQNSKVGTGDLTIDTGLPAPGRIVHAGIDFFNNANELVYLNRPGPLDVPRVVVRASLRERRAVTDAPFLPGTPPDGAAIDTAHTRFPALSRRVDGKRRGYVTTPPRCPRKRRWINRMAFTYADGVTQTVRSASRCKRKKARRR